MTTLDVEMEGDENLMGALVERRSGALEKLYGRYQGLLRNVAMNVVHNPLDAEEVLQDVFVHVWNRADAYSAEKGKLLGWLVMLAKRRAIDRLRQQSSYYRATSRFELEYQQNEPPVQCTGMNHQACLDDLRSLLKQQLLRLPPAQKQAVEMTFFDGMSQREIASAMQLPLGTVKTRIELGLRKLANILLTARLKIS